jgi:hypothetical protein
MGVAEAMNDTDVKDSGLAQIGDINTHLKHLKSLSREQLIKAATDGDFLAVGLLSDQNKLQESAPLAEPQGTVAGGVVNEATGVASQQPAGQIIPPGGITEAVPPQQVAAVEPQQQQQQQQQPQMLKTGGVVNLKDGFAARTYEESDVTKQLLAKAALAEELSDKKKRTPEQLALQQGMLAADYVRTPNKAAAMKADPITSIVGVPYEKLGGPEILEGIHSTREGMKDLAKQGSQVAKEALTEGPKRQHWANPDIYKGLVAGSLDTAGNWIDSATNLDNYKGVAGKGARAIGELTGIEALQNFRFDPAEAKKPPATTEADKTKKPPVTPDKADKADKAKKAVDEKGLQRLLAQATKENKGKSGMSEGTGLALMAAGAKMMASKRPDFLGAAGEGLGGFTTQKNLENKLATDRMIAKGRLATAGSTGANAMRTQQTALLKDLFAAKQKHAEALNAGGGVAAERLGAIMNSYARAVVKLSAVTGVFGQEEVDAMVAGTGVWGSAGRRPVIEDDEGIFGSAISGFKELF